MKNVSAPTPISTVHVQGTPLTNHLFLNGAAGAKIVQGDFCTITDGVTPDVYEFRDDSPPTGGTAGRIWIYNGADAAASRANLVKAINGTVDAAIVDRSSATNHHKVTASVATSGTYVTVYETTGIGNGVAQPTATAALQGTENLTTPTDIWDQANFLQYGVPGDLRITTCAVKLTAEMIAQGSIDFILAFPASHVILQNVNRQQNEAITISSDVYLALAGGISPNNQVDDVINAIIFG
jgi:hypothetical protein